MVHTNLTAGTKWDHFFSLCISSSSHNCRHTHDICEILHITCVFFVQQMCVTHIETPTLFWCQELREPYCTELAKFSQKLADICPSAPKVQGRPEVSKVNTFCFYACWKDLSVIVCMAFECSVYIVAHCIVAHCTHVALVLSATCVAVDRFSSHSLRMKWSSLLPDGQAHSFVWATCDACHNPGWDAQSFPLTLGEEMNVVAFGVLD